MKHISVGVANNLYICLNRCTIHKHTVYHKAFYDFCVALVKLERELGEQIEEDYWRELLRDIKYYRFLLNASLLPLNTYCNKLLPLVQRRLKDCQHYFPDTVPVLQKLIDKIFILSTLYDNPLSETVKEFISSERNQKVGLLLKEPYLFPLIQDMLSSTDSFQNIELVNQYQLRGTSCYHQLFVIGPSFWYPEYILRAPRAKEIHLIRYSWLTDKPLNTQIFLQPFTQHQVTSSNKEVEELDRYNTNNLQIAFGDMKEDILPELNWQNISSKVLRQIQEDQNQEQVSAKLYLLANELAVFLEASENTKVLVLDFITDEDDEDKEELQQIKRIALSKVQPGMFLLLRTEGGGDYIVSIANRILQDQALILRDKQEHWKSGLRKAVTLKGAFAISIELLDFGSECANEINVRNWMSSRSIRPKNDRDFHAIMKLVGLQNKEQEYREAAELIDQAHRKAGFFIRKQLLNQVKNVDLQNLHSKGYIDFELPEAGGGCLTAFRIESSAPGIFSIPASRLGHPIRVKNLFWAE